MATYRVDQFESDEHKKESRAWLREKIAKTFPNDRKKLRAAFLSEAPGQPRRRNEAAGRSCESGLVQIPRELNRDYPR